MKDCEIITVFDFVFGWNGYSIQRMKIEINKFLIKEGLTLQEVKNEM
jgi:hypothetical protein